MSPPPTDTFSSASAAALSLIESGRHTEAADFLRSQIALTPDSSDLHFLLGICLYLSGDREQALQAYTQAAQRGHIEAAYNKGVCLFELRDYANAIDTFETVITHSPGALEPYYYKGLTLYELGNFAEAAASLSHALELQPEFAEAFFARGNCRYFLKQFPEAIADYTKAISLQPEFATAYLNKGNAERELMLNEAALQSFGQALVADPNFAEAYSNRGNIFRDSGKPLDALANYDKAVALRPTFAEAHFNRGNVLRDMHRFDDALASYDRALFLNPAYSDAAYYRAVLLVEMKRFEDAIEGLSQILAANADAPLLQGLKFHCKMHLCDWSEYSDQLRAIADGVTRGKAVASPFSVLASPIPSALQQQLAVLYTNHITRLSERPLPARPLEPSKKIKLGYFSAELFDHPVMNLAAELFELHNRDEFEVIAFSYGPDSADPVRQRLKKSFDQFIDVRDQTDAAIADLAATMGIDIAVDLTGHTANSRLDIFARRAAPVQIHYLGYPGTLGARFFDYLVADHCLIPVQQRPQYTEKIIYLPDSYQANDTQRVIADRTFTRRELGLPDDGFVFCSFNNTFKITPECFDSWARILNRVPGSVLWLFENSPTATRNLKREAALRGIAGRIVFAGFMDRTSHLARLRVADLFLDSFHYNAHTTASDALWAGLPVLTLCGETFAGRVATSLLQAVGLPALSCDTVTDYEDRAVALALDKKQLSAFKIILSSDKTTLPLFNSARFARHMEAAYKQVWLRRCMGQAPAHVYVSPTDNPTERRV